MVLSEYRLFTVFLYALREKGAIPFYRLHHKQNIGSAKLLRMDSMQK